MYQAAAKTGLNPTDVDRLSLAQWLAWMDGHSAGQDAGPEPWSAQEFQALKARHGH